MLLGRGAVGGRDGGAELGAEGGALAGLGAGEQVGALDLHAGDQYLRMSPRRRPRIFTSCV